MRFGPDLDELVEALVLKHSPHEGMAMPGMEFVLKHCALAYEEASFGPALEIGSFKGRTAVAILDLLSKMFKDPPMLFTVDPYGSKFYRSGDSDGVIDYGDEVYLAHKKALAVYANHAHFLMPSMEFLWNIVDRSTPYWRRGHENTIGRFRFVLLDGEHDVTTIAKETGYITNLMATNGRVVIDNVDKDPKVIPYLLAREWELGPETLPGARQAVKVYK